MVQLYAFRRSLVALALCSAAIAASATPASARSHHGEGRHARYAGHHGRRHYAYRHYRHVARASRRDAGVAQIQMRGFADTHASLPSSTASGGMTMSGGFGSSNVVAEARRYIGGNPTARASLWCARFMNMVLQRSGYRGTGSARTWRVRSQAMASACPDRRLAPSPGTARRRRTRRHRERHRRRGQSDPGLRQ